MYIYIHIMKAVLRLVLTATDSKGVIKEQVSQISSILRKIGCRCVLDEPKRVVHKNGQLVCSNRFEPLSVVESLHLHSVVFGTAIPTSLYIF